MDAPINNFISILNLFESQYLVPFFNNETVIMSMIIFFALLALLIAPQHKKETDELFSVPLYRLLWILMTILLSLYKPVIGLLSAISYLIFTNTQQSETFDNPPNQSCPYFGPIDSEPTISDIQNQIVMN